MQWKPNVTVAAIVEKDGRFLLVEEYADDALVYNQPAGHLEKNETLIEAIRREVREETAYLRVCFIGHCDRHYPDQPLDEGIMRAVWLSREELEADANRLRSDLVLRCIRDYQSGQTFPLDLLHHQLSRS